MLWIIALILAVLWLIGVSGIAGALNSFIHVLLLLAIAVALIRIIQNRKPF